MRFLISVSILFALVACSIEEEPISFDPSAFLLISADTVSFDTLISETRSATRRLEIKNPNDEAVILESIRLGLGESSDFKVIINGRSQNLVEGEQLLSGDSLLILIEVNIANQNRNLPYIVKDSIIFNWNGNSEHVKLIAYGQDVRVRDKEVLCDEVWTNSRPYLIQDTLLVALNCQLLIEKGTKIFFENDAAIFIQGTLLAEGDSADRITFRNARFDGVFDQVPGQWNGIYFLEGSSGNSISYADIFNGQVGLRVGTPDEDNVPDVIIENTSIFNMSLAGILAFSSDIEAVNTQVYNCGTYLVGNFAGGTYSYTHCTLSNWPSLFSHEEASIQFSDNLVLAEEELLVSPLDVSITNTILWGSRDEELLINDGGDQQVSISLSRNIIRSAQLIDGNLNSVETNFPGFVDPFSADYSLDSLSIALDSAIIIGVDIDLEGKSRDSKPDIGAFERIKSN